MIGFEKIKGEGKRRRGCEILKKLIDALTLVGSMGEVFERTLRVSLHGLLSLLPVSRADFTVFLLDISLVSYESGQAWMAHTTNWNALIRRTVSSTERPTGRSLTVI